MILRFAALVDDLPFRNGTRNNILSRKGEPILDRLTVLGLGLLTLSVGCAPSGGNDSEPGTVPIAVSPDPGSSEPDASVGDPSIARGLEVYKSQYCGVCHTLSTAGSTGTTGPTHEGMGTIASQRIRDPDYVGAATTPEAYLRESIVAPAKYLVSGYELTRYRMPAYTNLDEAEVGALVEMLVRED